MDTAGAAASPQGRVRRVLDGLRARPTSEVAAAGAFGAYLLVAFVVLRTIGSDYWFWSDEWGFLAGRDLRDPEEWFRPQNGHWSTLPILFHRGLYSVFGLNSYAPYQTAVILLHLTLAVMLRAVMRRAGVGPWVATVVAGSFVLFGTGHQNMLLGVQVSMVGSMVLGIGHVFLVDHDGPFDRRDVAGLGLGALGVMASGVGPLLVAVAGLAALIRRGWVMALVHTAPLGVLYIVWWASFRPEVEGAVGHRFAPDIALEWIWHGQRGVFVGLGQFGVVAASLVVLLAVGLVLAWRPLAWPERRARTAVPLAMLAGAAGLFVVVSFQRGIFPAAEFAVSSRYVGMAAALTLPALAVAADAVCRRWRVATPLVLALFLVGIPGNVAAIPDDVLVPGFFAHHRAYVVAVAHSPLLDEVPDDHQPDPNPYRAAHLDVGLLRDARDTGRIPAPVPVEPGMAGRVALDLSTSVSSVTVRRARDCTTAAHHSVTLAADEPVAAIDGAQVVVLDGGQPLGRPVRFTETWSARAVRPQVTLEITPVGDRDEVQVCT